MKRAFFVVIAALMFFSITSSAFLEVNDLLLAVDSYVRSGANYCEKQITFTDLKELARSSLTRQNKCMDGNSNNGDGCSSLCLVEQGYSCSGTPSVCRDMFASCGNAVLDSAEQCDDGNSNSADGCSATCQIEQGYSCSGTPSVCINLACGNGIAENSEACDGNDLRGATCNLLAFATGTLSCTSDCRLSTSTCGSNGPFIPTVGEFPTLVVLLSFGGNSISLPGVQRDITRLSSYIEEQSYGKATLRTKIAGPYQISSDGCDPSVFDRNTEWLMQRAASSAAADPTNGNLEQYKKMIIITDGYNAAGYAVCASPNSGGSSITGGISTFNGARIYNGDLTATVAFIPYNGGALFHEFVHSMGGTRTDAFPAHLFNVYCVDQSGNRVPFSTPSLCQGNGRYDWSQVDAMSLRYDALGHLSAYAKEKLRWLFPQQIVATRSGDYTLTPLEVNDNNLKIIKVPTTDPSQFYYLEFRQPIGLDANPQYPSSYPSIFRNDPSLNGVFLYSFGAFLVDGLLDPPPYPDPTKFEPGPIPLNQPVTLPGYTITVTSVSPTGAQISIRQS